MCCNRNSIHIIQKTSIKINIIQKKREEEFDVDVEVGVDVGQGYALDVAVVLGVDVALVLVLGIVRKTDFLRIVRAPCILLLSNMKGAIRWKEY